MSIIIYIMKVKDLKKALGMTSLAAVAERYGQTRQTFWQRDSYGFEVDVLEDGSLKWNNPKSKGRSFIEEPIDED